MSFFKYLTLMRNLESMFCDATEAEVQEAGDCLVCREPMERGKKLTCGHVFHVDCLRGWLQHQQQCPLCRADIPVNGTGQRQEQHEPDDAGDAAALRAVQNLAHEGVAPADESTNDSTNESTNESLTEGAVETQTGASNEPDSLVTGSESDGGISAQADVIGDKEEAEVLESAIDASSDSTSVTSVTAKEGTAILSPKVNAAAAVRARWASASLTPAFADALTTNAEDTVATKDSKTSSSDIALDGIAGASSGDALSRVVSADGASNEAASTAPLHENVSSVGTVSSEPSNDLSRVDSHADSEIKSPSAVKMDVSKLIDSSVASVSWTPGRRTPECMFMQWEYPRFVVVIPSGRGNSDSVIDVQLNAGEASKGACPVRSIPVV